ncbi:MAG: chromate efflux transporter [Rickettsiales bacterium]|nr:chromate efflux transporter [Rickettsiales bacterium]
MNLWKLFLIFLRFGCLAWGGPVAQINMIREELVDKRKWLDPEKFKRVFTLYQILPGPEAHELCVYFGMVKAGRLGAIVAGIGFMLPGLLLMLALSYAYVSYGSTILLWFVGVTPAVSALIVRATHRISKHVLHSRSLVIAALISVALTLIHTQFFIVFIICLAWHVLWIKNYRKCAISVVIMAFIASGYFAYFAHSVIEITNNEPSEKYLFIEGLKGGLLTFGGAYTIIPFLHDSLLEAFPAITQQAFYDGIALSAMIPAPLVIFATYLGYLATGINGALLITAGVFLPSFLFTLLGHKQLTKLVENKAFHGALDGVAAAVCGLLLVTAFDIFQHSVLNGSLKNIAIFLVSLSLLYLINKKWIMPLVVVGSGLVGFILNSDETIQILFTNLI